MKKFSRPLNTIITTENLLQAWRAFLIGKKKKNDVAIFQTRLMDNILLLQDDLLFKRYTHGSYQSFNICDPKPRNIHKATVRDRLLHHLIYQEFLEFFDSKFIHNSYSCRLEKGVHRAMYQFEKMARKVSFNNTSFCWVLKCDIRKFFASIDHVILKNILSKYISNHNILWLFGTIIDSFSAQGKSGVGLPLGNLTSQLLVNVYMNEFDQFIKKHLKIKYYMRYADDFVILSNDKAYLQDLIPKIVIFLQTLKLELHPSKIFLKTHASGIDFLGWVHFPHHRVLRTTTKKRMFKQMKISMKKETFASYMGMLKHGNGHKLAHNLEKIFLQNKLDSH